MEYTTRTADYMEFDTDLGDEAFVPVGATFNSTGTTVLKTIDLVPGPASGYTPGSD